MNATKLMTIVAATAGATACMAIGSAHAHTPSYHRSATILQIESELSSHGQFIVLADFGRVWRPYGMPSDWSPYTRGYWDYEGDAWVWNSEFTWGWAAFHYGRWAFDPVYGWVWVPGSEWGPAWVAWSYDAGYVGWAPLPPGSLWIGSAWSVGFYPNSWCYARRSGFGRRRAFTRYVPGARRHGHVAHRSYPAPARNVRPARDTTRARPAGGTVARGRPANSAHAPNVKSSRAERSVVSPSRGTSVRRGVVDLGTVRRSEPRSPTVPARPSTTRIDRPSRPDVGSPSRANVRGDVDRQRSPLREVGKPLAPSRASSRTTFQPQPNARASSRTTFQAQPKPNVRAPSSPSRRSSTLVPSRPRTAPRSGATVRPSSSRSTFSPSRSSRSSRSTPSFSRAPRSAPSVKSSSSSSKKSSRASSSSKSSSRSSSRSVKSSGSRGRSAKRR